VQYVQQQQHCWVGWETSGCFRLRLGTASFVVLSAAAETGDAPVAAELADHLLLRWHQSWVLLLVLLLVPEKSLAGQVVRPWRSAGVLPVELRLLLQLCLGPLHPA
jgi:hypothetical protein